MKEIETPRGARIRVAVSRPPATLATGAAVVLAPGRRYDASRALMVRCSETVCEAGLTAVRFDWAYTGSGGDPSDDNTAELEDLQTAIELARRIDGIERVIVAGKSMGSRVAARAAAADSAIAGLALLTPALHGMDVPGDPWIGREVLWSASVPVLIAVGDSDPICHIEALAMLLREFPRRPQLIVVPGDHSFGCSDPAQTPVSINAVADTLATWAANL